jgi:hypothetical protein
LKQSNFREMRSQANKPRNPGDVFASEPLFLITLLVYFL